LVAKSTGSKSQLFQRFREWEYMYLGEEVSFFWDNFKCKVDPKVRRQQNIITQLNQPDIHRATRYINPKVFSIKTSFFQFTIYLFAKVVRLLRELEDGLERLRLGEVEGGIEEDPGNARGTGTKRN
jgi:hypothetical protein